MIISGSPIFSNIQLQETDFIIACDGGYRHALAHHIKPDLIVGDFDSFAQPINPPCEIMKAPSEKDDTDTMMAVKYALERNMKNIILLGATGGRIDHQLANFSTAAYIAEHGGTCTIADSDNIIYALKNQKITLDRRNNWSISVFSYTDQAAGVSYSGLKYNLTNVVLTNTFPLGVSNEFSEEKASIEVASGILFVVLSNLEHE